MIRRPELLQALDDEFARRTPVDFAANRRAYDELYRHAVRLGILPLRDPLEGIETVVRLARALNARLPARAPGDGT